MHRPTLLLLTPIAPSPTGNGLAMRCHTTLTAAARDHAVDLVVVPVAGSVAGAPPPAVEGTVRPRVLAPSPVDDRQGTMAWLADPAVRSWIDALAPVPAPVLGVPPWRAPELVGALGVSADAVRGVVAVRLALAPLGRAVAERLGVPLVVDADDDDVGLHLAAGDEDAAAAWDRVARLVLPAAARVLVASPADHGAMADRYDLGERVAVAPNAAPPRRTPSSPPPTSDRRALLVGNLTYGPNEDAARWFVDDVLPLLDPAWSVDLVGAPSPGVAALAGDRVRVAGWVPDLDPWYEQASVVVAPLRSGSGTRIKVLEAFVQGRPVVATAVGCAGLQVRDAEHLLVADEAPAFAAAVERAAEPATAAHLVRAAGRLVERTYDAAVVTEGLAALLAEALGPAPPLTTDPGPDHG